MGAPPTAAALFVFVVALHSLSQPAAAAAAATAASLQDEPVVGSATLLLDGDGWVARTVARRPPPGPASACHYLKDTDLDQGTKANSSDVVDASTPAECCAACAGRQGCAASVWFGVRCWLKSAEQSKPAARSHHAGRTACVQNTTRGASTSARSSARARDDMSASASMVIPATVPGDIISDLHRAGVVPNPYYELNWLNSSAWAGATWRYERAFEFTPPTPRGQGTEVLLVLYGVKMGATVALNGHMIGTVTDQFVRYEFPVARFLKAGANNLTVTFDGTIECDGRWMACSGGWDWAFYSNQYAPNRDGTAKAHTFSFGLWKSVALVTVPSAAITHVVAHTFYQGAYPTQPLLDGQHGGFDVRVRVHLWAPHAGAGQLAVTGAWGQEGGDGGAAGGGAAATAVSPQARTHQKANLEE